MFDPNIVLPGSSDASVPNWNGGRHKDKIPSRGECKMFPGVRVFEECTRASAHLYMYMSVCAKIDISLYTDTNEW